MKLWVPLLCFISLAFAVMLYGEDSDEKGLTGTYLFSEYERLVPLNEAIWEGRWVPKGGEYPKTLGMFNSKKVEEIWECGGDLCPQNSAVMIVFHDVSENDCSSVGEPLYLIGWGPHFMGCSPLLDGEETLIDKGFSWSIAYLPCSHRSKAPKPNPAEAPLLFDDSSVCTRQGKKIPCDEFKEGQKGILKATRSGYSFPAADESLRPCRIAT